MSKKKKTKRARKKINKKRVLFVLCILLFVVLIFYKVFNTNITNIYISGNKYLTDQEIIDIAKLSNYPKSISNLSISIKNRLEKNTYIMSASVKKNILLNKVTISIKENYPLFYYLPKNKTILYSEDELDSKFTTTTVINSIPDKVYEKFLKKLKYVDLDILSRMSEIEYKPNEVDQERFFILMNDGNYVYLSLNRFLSINKYFDMIKSFENKKGILHLDSGEYFEIFE